LYHSCKCIRRVESCSVNSWHFVSTVYIPSQSYYSSRSRWITALLIYSLLIRKHLQTKISTNTYTPSWATSTKCNHEEVVYSKKKVLPHFQIAKYWRHIFRFFFEFGLIPYSKLQETK
jgi:hypothetical protein